MLKKVYSIYYITALIRTLQLVLLGLYCELCQNPWKTIWFPFLPKSRSGLIEYSQNSRPLPNKRSFWCQSRHCFESKTIYQQTYLLRFWFTDLILTFFNQRSVQFIEVLSHLTLVDILQQCLQITLLWVKIISCN